jgi:hypothetical protein
MFERRGTGEHFQSRDVDWLAPATRYVFDSGGITLALSGRALSAAARRGRTMYQGARGAHVTTHHGPLERVVRTHNGMLAVLWEMSCKVSNNADSASGRGSNRSRLSSVLLPELRKINKVRFASTNANEIPASLFADMYYWH